jgi:hypothetical protein
MVVVREGLFKAIGADAVTAEAGQNQVWLRRTSGRREAASRKRVDPTEPRSVFMSTDPMQVFGKAGMDAAMSAFSVWGTNAQAIATEVADYSKKSFESSTAAFQKIVSAKSLERAVEVQSEYLRAACEELVAGSTRIGELYAGMAREACKPFEDVLWRSPFAR